MAKIPEVSKNGFHTIVSGETTRPEMIEKFNYDNEDYDLIYKSMDPNTNKMVVVKPDIAKIAIKEFIQNEIGGYIDGEFKIINEHINNKFENIKIKLKEHIQSKIDVLAEEIATEMISSNFKEAVENKVKEKLLKLKGLIDD